MTDYITVDRDVLEAVAFNYSIPIELTADRAYLVLDGVTFAAALTAVTQ
jgi:hypothetical protein